MKKINRYLNHNKKDSLSTEFPDYIYRTSTLESLKVYTKDLNTRLNKNSKSNQLLIEDNKLLSEQILLYSNLFLNINDDSYNVCDPLSGVFKILGELIKEVENGRNKFDQSIRGKWINQLNEFQRVDAKECQLAKNRYDKSRIEFDNASEQFKQLRKKQQNGGSSGGIVSGTLNSGNSMIANNGITTEKLLDAEASLDYATQQFSDIASESLSQMEDIIEKHNQDSFDSISSTIQSYKEFFQRGLELCDSAQPELDKQKQQMLKYKQQLADKKKLRSTVVTFEQQTYSSKLIATPNTSPPQQPPQQIVNNQQQSIVQPTIPTPLPSQAIPKGITKIFGMPLQSIVDREKTDIPSIIDKSIQYLMLEENITQEGIFRVSPNQKQLTEMKSNVNAGYITTLDGFDDAYLISSFLKSFFREMPIPIFTFDLYPQLIDCVINEEKFNCDKLRISEVLAMIISKLPKPNYILVKRLMSLLYKISTKSSQNKMNTSNLAVVIAPNILYPKQLDIRSLTNSNTTIEFIISNFNNIFNNPILINLYGNGNGSSGNNGNVAVVTSPSNPRHSVMLGSTPPTLPTRPVTMLFKNAPLTVTTTTTNNNNSNFSSAPTSSASPPQTPTKPPTFNSSPSNPRHSVMGIPPSLPPKKLSSSLTSLPPPPPVPVSVSSLSNINNNNNNNNNTQQQQPQQPTISPLLTSSLSSSTPPPSNPLRSSTGTSSKPISNRVSMYLQNSSQSTPIAPPPKPRVINNNSNSNGGSNNSGSGSNTPTKRLSTSMADMPPPLAPLNFPSDLLEPSIRNPNSNSSDTITISDVNWN